MERPEEAEWIAAFRPDEEQESGAVLLLEYIAAACRRVFASGALRLPVEPTGTHGKILVTGLKERTAFGTGRFFANQIFHFEALRALGYMQAGGVPEERCANADNGCRREHVTVADHGLLGLPLEARS